MVVLMRAIGQCFREKSQDIGFVKVRLVKQYILGISQRMSSRAWGSLCAGTGGLM